MLPSLMQGRGFWPDRWRLNCWLYATDFQIVFNKLSYFIPVRNSRTACSSFLSHRSLPAIHVLNCENFFHGEERPIGGCQAKSPRPGVKCHHRLLGDRLQRKPPNASAHTENRRQDTGPAGSEGEESPESPDLSLGTTSRSEKENA